MDLINTTVATIILMGQSNADMYRGVAYAIAAVVILYTIVGVFDILTFGLTEPSVIILVNGVFFWLSVWAFGGGLIGRHIEHHAKPRAAGSLYGGGFGAVTAGILIAWPYCSQPSDPNPQRLLMGIGEPVILLYNSILGIFKLSESSILFLLMSITFWALFGAILSMVIRKKDQKGFGAGIGNISSNIGS